MRRGEIFGEPEPGFPAIWGTAAWAQTQLTPGVSTLAAPRSKKEKREGPQPRTPNTAVDLVHHCFVCGLELTHEIQGEETS